MEPSPFCVGERVYVRTDHIRTNRTARKFAEKKIGPFPIISQPSPTSFTIRLPSTIRIHPVFYVSQLEAIPSLAYSLYISTSAVLPIVHFIHLSYCCLNRPCHYVGYQHLISTAWPEPHDVVANAHYPSTSYFNLRSIATITILILLIYRPIAVLDPYLHPPSTQLVAYSRFVSRGFSFITDCQPSTLCHDLGSYKPYKQSTSTRHTRLPPFYDRHIEQSNALELSAFFLLQASPFHISSDRGSGFTSHFFRSLGALLRMRLHFTSGHHPSANGQVERVNNTLEQYLRIYCNYEQDKYCSRVLLTRSTCPLAEG